MCEAPRTRRYIKVNHGRTSVDVCPLIDSSRYLFLFERIRTVDPGFVVDAPYAEYGGKNIYCDTFADIE